MFPYWILFSVFAAGSLQYRTQMTSRLQGGAIFLAAGLLVILMIGLRLDVGGDWVNYQGIFQYIHLQDFGKSLQLQDPGYGGLNWIVAKLGFGIWAVNLVCAAIFTWGVFRFARRQPNPWLVILVAVPYLIIVVAMGYTRQSVAIGLIVAALADFDRLTWKRLLVFLLAAAAFHKSAAVVLPLIALSDRRSRLTTIVLLLLTLVLVYYLFIQSSVDKLMTNYIVQEYSSQGALVRVLMNMPPALMFLAFHKRFGLSDRENRLWRNFALASFIAFAMLMITSSSAAVDRLALYLIPLQMFVLGRLPVAFPERGRLSSQLVVAVVVYSAMIQFVWLNYADNSGYWLPYRLGIASEPDQ